MGEWDYAMKLYRGKNTEEGREESETGKIKGKRKQKRMTYNKRKKKKEKISCQ